jgi:hypothetical protein
MHTNGTTGSLVFSTPYTLMQHAVRIRQSPSNDDFQASEIRTIPVRVLQLYVKFADFSAKSAYFGSLKIHFVGIKEKYSQFQ